MSSLSRILLRCAALATLISAPAHAELSSPQIETLKAALAAQAAGNFQAGVTRSFRDVPAADKLLTWDRLRRMDYPASFSEFSEFLRENRGWPGEPDLRIRAEGTINDTTPMAARLTYFRALPPQSGIGRFRHAEALLAAGLTSQANTEAKAAWRSASIGRANEAQFLATFAGALTREDHAARADVLLWNGNVDGVNRMLPYLDGSDRLLVEARLALRRAANARGAAVAPASVEATMALGKLGNAFDAHPGLLADRSNFLRMTGSSLAARQLLARSRIVPGSAGDRGEWMKEVLAAARGAVNDGQFQLAYDIARMHGGFSLDHSLIANPADERDTYTSLEWLAGWTALHRLARPVEAIRHFENFTAAAATSTTRARGHYWAGRSASRANRAEEAKKHFAAAARYPLTFYGQLAAQELGVPLTLPPLTDPVVSAAERAEFNNRPLVEVARFFGRTDDRGRQTLFLKAMSDAEKTSAESFMISELAASIGRTDYALIASRGERADGPPAIMRFAFPQLGIGPSLSHNWTMIHAITRQESRFDREAVSHAGARGLMQLMPATARETAGKIGQSYRYEGLTGDPEYNVQLGSTYYSNLVDQWGGNHVLAVASYNAGSGNTRKWIALNGDPRLPGADIIQWIEGIPIFETRNYVQRVLENAVVYDRINAQRTGRQQSNALSYYLGNGRSG